MTPRRAAIGAAGITALLLLGLVWLQPLPARVLGWFGGDELGRRGGMVMTWRSADGDTRVVRVPGVAPDDVQQTAQRIGGTGRLEFHEVLETDAMKELFKLLGPHGRTRPLAGMDIDQWREDDGRTVHDDYYVYGPTPGAIETQLAQAKARGWKLPDGMGLAYEHHVSQYDSYWRTYVITDAAAIDGSSVANATGTTDVYSNRPIVLVDFDREGARRFGDLTERIVGHKLAIMLDGEVRSAPVIMTAIRGGRASISLGAGTVEQMERDQHALVAALSAGSLPAGGQVLDAKYEPPSRGVARTIWLARGVITLLGCGLAALFGWLVARKVALRVVEVETGEGAGGPVRVVRRLAWTALGLLLLLVGSQIALPGVNEYEMAHIVVRGGGSVWFDTTQVSLFALGIAPLITSFVSIEIIASLVPRWRPLRDTPEGRRKLGRAVAIAALLVSAVQAYFIAVYLEALSRGGAEVIVNPGLRERLIIVATLTAGTATIAWIVSIITHRGLGNGYAVALVATWLFRLPWTHLDTLTPASIALGVVVVAVVAVVLLTVMRWRVGGLPIPTAGTAPLAQAGGLGTGVLTVSALGISALQIHAAGMLEASTHLVPGALFVLVGAAAWSYVFARPGRRAAVTATQRDWMRATAVSAGALLVIYVVTYIRWEIPELHAVLEPITLCTVIAITADLFHEARARGHQLVPVWPLHDPLLVDAARARLTAEAIPHYLQSVRLRRLLWLFGSYAPIMVFVPPDRAVDADRVLREL